MYLISLDGVIYLFLLPPPTSHATASTVASRDSPTRGKKNGPGAGKDKKTPRKKSSMTEGDGGYSPVGRSTAMGEENIMTKSANMGNAFLAYMASRQNAATAGGDGGGSVRVGDDR